MVVCKMNLPFCAFFQVAVSTRMPATSHIPNYPSLPSQLMCQVHNVTLHVGAATDSPLEI